MIFSAMVNIIIPKAQSIAVTGIKLIIKLIMLKLEKKSGLILKIPNTKQNTPKIIAIMAARMI